MTTEEKTGKKVIQFPDGERLPAVPASENCCECGAEEGQYHSPAGCDNERCPRCGGQLWHCDCVTPPAVREKQALMGNLDHWLQGARPTPAFLAWLEKVTREAAKHCETQGPNPPDELRDADRSKDLDDEIPF